MIQPKLKKNNINATGSIPGKSKTRQAKLLPLISNLTIPLGPERGLQLL
jgi:hypothetical protein